MHDDIIICVADALAEQLAGCVACGSTQQQQQQQQQMELKQANCQAARGRCRRLVTAPLMHARLAAPYRRKSARSPCCFAYGVLMWVLVC